MLEEDKILQELALLDQKLHRHRKITPPNDPSYEYSLSDIEDQYVEDSLFGDRELFKPIENIAKQGETAMMRKTSMMHQKSTASLKKSTAKDNCSKPILKQNIDANRPVTLQDCFEVILHKAVESKTKTEKSSKYCSEQSPISLQCTFKPKILKRSQDLALKPIMQRLSTRGESKKVAQPYKEMIQNKKKYSVERIEQLSRPRELKTLQSEDMEEEPSFHPKLSKKSLSQMSNLTVDVAKRNKIWLEQRENKVAKLRMEQEKEKLKRQSCTYSPVINHYKGEPDARFSKFGKEGLQNFFERVTSRNNQKGERLKTESMELSKEIPRKSTLKKQNYEQAVRDLHNRILKMNI